MTPPGMPLMDIAEFVRDGYLHEVNRRFLHPLGLALEVTHEDRCSWCKGSGVEPLRLTKDCEHCDGTGKRPEDQITYEITGVWDDRDDPEGIRFGLDVLSPEAEARIDKLWEARKAARVKALGYMVQPADPKALTAAAVLDA